MRGLILAAPASGSGKTTLTLGLLRALRDSGVIVRGAKSGPDYIDPAFHAAASGRPSVNLDAWAMPPDQLLGLAAEGGSAPRPSGPPEGISGQPKGGAELLLIEGAMGLFDGAPPDGRGATADLARLLGLPVVLVVDAGRMAQSVAPLVAGFAGQDPEVRIAGVILNRVGSERHERMLRRALEPLGLPVLGALRRDPALALPERHLGLVQAGEHGDLDGFLARAGQAVAAAVDLDALSALAGPLPAAAAPTPPVDGRRYAVARDAAFSFLYPHQLIAWQAAGAEVAFFSPLADEPVPDADAVYLPGGYPELHAERLAGAATFMQSLRNAAQTSVVYGECGGYMVLGESLTDAGGTRHRMAGLLGLATSFAERRLHLGYRHLESRAAALAGRYRGHEFHYATTLAAEGAPLFGATDAEGTELPPMGLVEGRVMGSFAHVIAPQLVLGPGPA